MGTYVRGMDLPDDCRFCPFESYNNVTGVTACTADNNHVMAENFRTLSWNGRAEWCPLVEVSIPHGRLIDADVFQDQLTAFVEQENTDLSTDAINSVLAVIRILKDQLSIIEGEYDGKKNI